MTLREVKTKTASTNGAPLPTARQLRYGRHPIVALAESADARICVYANGFVLYQSGQASTVFRMEQCTDYTYRFDGGQTHLSEDFFLDQDFSILLFLIGEDRLQHNRSMLQQVHEDTLFTDQEEIERLEDEKQNVEDQYLYKEMYHRLISVLTPRQSEIWHLRYGEDLTLREIGKRLGISHQAVSCILTSARRAMKKAV